MFYIFKQRIIVKYLNLLLLLENIILGTNVTPKPAAKAFSCFKLLSLRLNWR